MKKNYVKPILLSETFVTENIMDGTGDKKNEVIISGMNLEFINGDGFPEAIDINAGMTLNSISFDSFVS